MYLSIDFEDFNHDFKRSLGLWNTGPLKVDILWEKYLLIDQFFKKSNSNNGSFGTFFCTGIIAEKEPDLIKRIAEDGHEIACHYYFHDDMRNENLDNVEKTLRKAKDLLQEASGKKVNGFRAPYFKIENKTHYQYELVEKIFEYDSSFACTTKSELEIFKKNMRLKNLKLLPVFQKKLGKLNFKLGGTFLKFPNIYTYWMINQSIKNGFIPHIYMHPYEFGNSEELRLTMKDLQVLGFNKSIYWKFRQLQWLKIRNNSCYDLIKILCNNHQLKGTLGNIN